MSLFRTENLTYCYPDKKKPSLRNIDLEVEQGETVLLAGTSGCGKSTLLKILAGLYPGFSGGRLDGQIYFRDKEIEGSLAPKVGILFQDPEKQVLLSEVDREIAFGMENLGISRAVMKRRLAEVVDFTGLEGLTGKNVSHLSAGQRQKVALASVLAMDPEVILLDEPFSQADPISAEELVNVVRKMSEDTGKTLVLAEQKLERCLHFVDRVVAMEDGSIRFQGSPEQYCRWAANSSFGLLPPVPRFFAAAGFEKLPLTVKEGRNCLSELKAGTNTLSGREETEAARPGERQEISIRNLWFSYDSSGDVLKNISLDIYKGSFVSILGRNGTGKTTLLKNINSLLKPVRGSIQVDGKPTKGLNIYQLSQKIGYLSQNPDNYLLNDTVREEINYTLNNFRMKWDKDTDVLVKKLELEDFLDANPRDLSMGQRQRTVLASVLSVSPEILLLDEPTRGMDYMNKNRLGQVLLDLKAKGTTIVLVTHDVEFAAEFSDRLIIMFNGEIAADGEKRAVLKDGLYYTTQLGRLFHGVEDIYTFEDAQRWLSAISR